MSPNDIVQKLDSLNKTAESATKLASKLPKRLNAITNTPVLEQINDQFSAVADRKSLEIAMTTLSTSAQWNPQGALSLLTQGSALPGAIGSAMGSVRSALSGVSVLKDGVKGATGLIENAKAGLAAGSSLLKGGLNLLPQASQNTLLKLSGSLGAASQGIFSRSAELKNFGSFFSGLNADTMGLASSADSLINQVKSKSLGAFTAKACGLGLPNPVEQLSSGLGAYKSILNSATQTAATGLAILNDAKGLVNLGQSLKTSLNGPALNFSSPSLTRIAFKGTKFSKIAGFSNKLQTASALLGAAQTFSSFKRASVADSIVPEGVDAINNDTKKVLKTMVANTSLASSPVGEIDESDLDVPVVQTPANPDHWVAMAALAV